MADQILEKFKTHFIDSARNNVSAKEKVLMKLKLVTIGLLPLHQFLVNYLNRIYQSFCRLI